MNRKPTMYSFIHFKPGQLIKAYRPDSYDCLLVFVLAVTAQDSNFNHYKLFIDGLIIPVVQNLHDQNSFRVFSDTPNVPPNYKGQWIVAKG